MGWGESREVRKAGAAEEEGQGWVSEAGGEVGDGCGQKGEAVGWEFDR